jgi:hypothetical protein
VPRIYHEQVPRVVRLPDGSHAWANAGQPLRQVLFDLTVGTTGTLLRQDPWGFAVKFYTEDGNWDLGRSNTPISFVKDPKKFGDFIHTQTRDPRTS